MREAFVRFGAALAVVFLLPGVIWFGAYQIMMHGSNREEFDLQMQKVEGSPRFVMIISILFWLALVLIHA